MWSFTNSCFHCLQQGRIAQLGESVITTSYHTQTRQHTSRRWDRLAHSHNIKSTLDTYSMHVAAHVQLLHEWRSQGKRMILTIPPLIINWLTGENRLILTLSLFMAKNTYIKYWEVENIQHSDSVKLLHWTQLHWNVYSAEEREMWGDSTF